MYTRKRNWTFIPGLVLGISTFLGMTSSLVADSRTGRSRLDLDAEEALRNAGVSLNDTVGLIHCLRAEDQYLASMAAYALGNLPKTEDGVRALNEVAFSRREMMMLYAIRSLHKVGDTQWVVPALERFSKIVDPHVKIPIAGLLAQRGHYDGWKVIVQESKRGLFVWDTVEAIPAFKGMRNADGTPVDLIAVLKDLENTAPKSNLPAIRRAMQKVSPTATVPGSSPEHKR